MNKSISELMQLHGARFDVYNDFGAIHGYWDGYSLQRVVENLATNAIKYGDVNGTVSIGVQRSRDTVEISVHNEGKPIPMEEQNALFKAFSRSSSAVKSGHKGWGIGLMLVKGIVEAHYGSIRLESDNISGTTFFICLPLDSRTEPAILLIDSLLRSL